MVETYFNGLTCLYSGEVLSCHLGFHEHFQQGGNWFSQVSKTI